MKKLITFFLGLMLGVACSFSTAAAEQRPLHTDTSEKVDAVLLLDTSGSMLLTDPGRLRDEGAKLFIQFLKPGDRLAVVEFAREAKVIRPLSPYDSSQSDQIAKDLSSLTSAGPYTDILAGVKLAKSLLEAQPAEDAKQVIVLLSDGKMDPDPLIGTANLETIDLTNNYLPELKAKDIKLHTLAFSDLADRDFLAQIAAATDGSYWYTPTADKVHESYAEIFVAIKKPQIVPLTSKGFKIDSDIDEATFYINREENADTTIRAPTGEEMTSASHPENVKWFRSQKFDVITIASPEEGDWRAVGISASDGFATVLTNLKLVTEWPPAINSGSATLLQARLYESDKPVVLPEMSGATQYAFQVTPTDKVSEPIIREFLVDDGTNGDLIERDGIFSFNLTVDEPGEYKLRVVARAPTFERQQQLPFRVKPRVVALSVVAVEKFGELSEEGEHGSSEDMFRIDIGPDAAGLKKIQVKLFAIDEERHRYDLVLRQAKNLMRFEAPVSLLKHEGEYEVRAIMTAETKKGSPVQEESQLLKYKKGVTQAAHEEEVEVLAEIPVEVVPPPLWPFAALITLANIGFAAYCLITLKKSGGHVTFVLPQFEPAEGSLALVADLEARAALKEVDLNDPRFSDEAPSAAAQPSEQLEQEATAPAASTTEEQQPAAESTEPTAAEATAAPEASPENVEAPPAEPAPEEEAPLEGTPAEEGTATGDNDATAKGENE